MQREAKNLWALPFTAPGHDISTGTFIEDVHIDGNVKKILGTVGLVMGVSTPAYDENGRVVTYWSNHSNFGGMERMFQDVDVNLKELGFPDMAWAVLVRIPEDDAVVEASAIQSKVFMTDIICLAIMLPIGWEVGRQGARQVSTVQEAALIWPMAIMQCEFN